MKTKILAEMHKKGKKMCSLNHNIVRYNLLRIQIIEHKDDIEFCKAHLDYLHEAYDSCSSDYDKECYSLQIYNTEQELYKAQKKLEKALTRLNDAWYKKQITAYKFINLAYRNLQNKYSKNLKK